ncbi:multidrug ABC transporter ATP-binding protein [Edaphobacter acidisoli]|uniref:Multidrug ABC transporter ATP-binding protein n=1 Tax=Edaphobacter acidisoli TaxID=2040573 RepID=A0A916S0R7_9BACT|nr:ABC transporter ATP-binding protein [Edaphobacter acidisoli]GGA76416.1 multidrug ABC transporter ATP-binding protein [Edaphobacter acidisoli]
MASVIETIDLKKNYGNQEAVRGLNLSVQAGSVCAFLGQNGAGKSSTIKMLLGMIHPTSGTGSIFGHRIDKERESLLIRQKVAFVAEDKRLYDYMSVSQIIHFTRSFFPNWNHALEANLLERFELPPERKVRQLSKGMRTKLALLLGFARGCELLILDEPTEGLDPVAIEDVLQIVVSLASDGTTIFFSSHQIAEVEQVADHVLMIHRGKLVLDASMDRIKEQYRQIQAVFPDAIEERDLRLPGIERVHLEGRTASFVASHNIDSIVEHVRMLRAGSIDVLPISLKEIFLEKVKTRS